MLKYALLAVAAATAIAVVFVMLPTGGGQRPEPRILNAGDPAPSTGFVIHDAPVPTPGTPTAATTPPATPGDLDAVMQRLRAAAAKPDPNAPATVPPTPPGTTPATPAATPPGTPPIVVSPTDPAATPPVVAAPTGWSAVTAQGTRWRMVKSPNGYTVAIDLGGGQTANVHVQPAFGALDPASVNVRVDYLRQTILQNFTNRTGTYSFARDGSVSVDQ
ncbi:hypothetical protein [Acidisphaera sp. L21]|uniref:hypothetical protein n=1 Tax=Acidisphaera sp. L21 TaxID=1641851 RepID=UPI00131D7E0A|nr:hypothetical protein [Acidisphaera sp. L21]